MTAAITESYYRCAGQYIARKLSQIYFKPNQASGEGHLVEKIANTDEVPPPY